MKLTYSTDSKDPLYKVGKSVRNGKHVGTVVVKVIGRHSELKKKYDDPLAYARQVVAEYNRKEKEAEGQFEISINLKERLSGSESNSYSKSTLVNIGYFFLQSVYQKLDLNSWFKTITKTRRFKYDANQINRILTFARILDPKSKLGTFDTLGTYYEKPDFSYDDIMSFLTLLEQNYESYIEYLFQKSENIIKRNTAVCYYDCTNFYFEIEQQDEDYIDEYTGEVIPGFRKFGPSKEHRPNPLVEMGLFMDSNGIPITMSLHSGNTNEQVTAVPLEKQLVKMVKGKELIYCADAGLGSANIRLFNDLGGRAFVVTQSIKKMSDQLQKSVFNDYDYRLLSNNDPVTIDSMKSFDPSKDLKLYNDFAYKVIQADKAIDLGLTEEKKLKNGKVKMVKSKANLKQRVIITFSRKMFEYQRNIRAKQIERAKKMIATADPETIKKGPNDVRRFIKQKGRKEKLEYVLDEEKINEESKYDGYYAVATNLNDNVSEILAITKQRYKIEDCFRIMKTNFKARPAYSKSTEHTKAHFMTCYTALLIYRLIEVQLDQQGTHHTTRDIIETMKNMNMAVVNKSLYVSTFEGSTTLTDLIRLSGLQLDYKNYVPASLKKIFKKITK